VTDRRPLRTPCRHLGCSVCVVRTLCVGIPAVASVTRLIFAWHIACNLRSYAS
jgi:hypothetical protein